MNFSSGGEARGRIRAGEHSRPDAGIFMLLRSRKFFDLIADGNCRWGNRGGMENVCISEIPFSTRPKIRPHTDNRARSLRDV